LTFFLRLIELCSLLLCIFDSVCLKVGSSCAEKAPRRLNGLSAFPSTSSITDTRGMLLSLQPGVSRLVGKRIDDAGLRGQPDAFLVSIDRGSTTLHAVAPSEVLQAGDILWFAGNADGIILLRKVPGAAANVVVRQ
jgi:Trk K+ transport system NAD-binding subunit